MSDCTLELDQTVAHLLKRVSNGVPQLAKTKVDGAALKHAYKVPDGVSVYVDRSKHKITKVEKHWLNEMRRCSITDQILTR